jgi:hypothetical protein
MTGAPMVEVIKELQVTEATWYRWLNRYGSEKNAEASKRAKELGEGERPAQASAGGEGAGHRHSERGGEGKILSPEPAVVPCAWRWRS